jgi:hypothetical protein
MTDRFEPLSSLPSRPLDLDEIEDLEDNDRIVTIQYDDETVETADRGTFAYNCVLVLSGSLTGAVYEEDEETWYRVYHEPRPDAEMEAAYDAVREARGDDSLFSRAPLTVDETVFKTDRPAGEDTSGYVAGDDFPCPVCDETHTVRFQDEEYGAGIDGLDTSYLYVACPAARQDQLIVEFQAKTRRDTAPTGE